MSDQSCEPITVSMLAEASAKTPKPAKADAVIEAIRSGKYQRKVEAIRKLYGRTLEQTGGDHAAAKKAVDPLKKKLPAIQWCGEFTGRGDGALAAYSGLLCADLDHLDPKQQAAAREKLKDDPHVFALFDSPTNTGLKVVFKVEQDETKHTANFLTVKRHVMEVCGLAVDESCKNAERLCFVSHDPQAYLNTSAEPLPAIVELPAPPAPPPTPPSPARNGDERPVNLELRRKVAADVIGCIAWKSDSSGFCECPGWQTHTTETKPEDCRVTVDRAPTLFCFHDSCRGAVEAKNHELRSAIGKEESRGPLLELLRSREFNANIEPPPLRPIYALAGTAVSTPGNLTTLNGPPKAAKTAVIGAMVASPMRHIPEADLLGFTSDNPKELALLVCDSEQAPDDFWHCVNRALRRAGLQRPPPWLHAYCLTGLGCKRGWEAVMEAVKIGADSHGGIHSILLDGAADFVADVNDPAESNAFVAELHDMAIRHDCPIIGVIHFNPGSEKSRGHLGSQLERKAETNLALEKDADETTVIYSTKNRRAGIPKSRGPRFKFSIEAGMHISIESRESAKDAHDRTCLGDIAADAFNGHPAMRRTDIEATLKNELRVSDATSERRVSRMIALGIIRKSVAGLYTLAMPAESK